jgi:hypothetical protein
LNGGACLPAVCPACVAVPVSLAPVLICHLILCGLPLVDLSVLMGFLWAVAGMRWACLHICVLGLQ